MAVHRWQCHFHQESHGGQGGVAPLLSSRTVRTVDVTHRTPDELLADWSVSFFFRLADCSSVALPAIFMAEFQAY